MDKFELEYAKLYRPDRYHAKKQEIAATAAIKQGSRMNSKRNSAANLEVEEKRRKCEQEILGSVCKAVEGPGCVASEIVVPSEVVEPSGISKSSEISKSSVSWKRSKISKSSEVTDKVVVPSESLKHSENAISSDCKFGREFNSSTPELYPASETAPSRKYNINDIYEMGVWATADENLRHLFQFKMYDFRREQTFNIRRTFIDPYCIVCQFFVPKAVALEAKHTIPHMSRRILNTACFRRFFDTSASNSVSNLDSPTASTWNSNSPTAQYREEPLLRCDQCFIAVHPTCYGLGRNAFPENLGNWKCDR